PSWLTKPFYVVGPATAKAARRLNFTPIGESTGTADALASLIIASYPSTSPPLLFLAGDKRRDVLPTRLAEARVPFQELQSYETRPSSRFRADLEAEVGGRAGVDWVVFFSPSGVDVAVNALRELEGWGKTRVACIGPTSERRATEVGLRVEAVAAKPGPQELLDAIV
ncbi:tetrapyrrole biosynthesis, uroporphyrinogen III synthase, partial [Blyttiomyces helicus]